jgi:hypothetical protein
VIRWPSYTLRHQVPFSTTLRATVDVL